MPNEVTVSIQAEHVDALRYDLLEDLETAADALNRELKSAFRPRAGGQLPASREVEEAPCTIAR